MLVKLASIEEKAVAPLASSSAISTYLLLKLQQPVHPHINGRQRWGLLGLKGNPQSRQPKRELSKLFVITMGPLNKPCHTMGSRNQTPMKSNYKE